MAISSNILAFPFLDRRLNHNILWIHANSTDRRIIHHVMCDGDIVCSVCPKDGQHSLTAALSVDRNVLVSNH